MPSGVGCRVAHHAEAQRELEWPAGSVEHSGQLTSWVEYGACSPSSEGLLHQVLRTAGSLWMPREDPGVFGASIWGLWSSLPVFTGLWPAPNVSHYSV